MKKFIPILITVIFLFCSCSSPEKSVSTGNLKVIATSFVPYDFLREIGGDKLDLTLLIRPGTELHSYEPSPKDIIEIGNADLFVYMGGESDVWVENIILSDNSPKNSLALTNCVTQPENHLDHNHEHTDFDEHVWTSLANSVKICERITEILCTIDVNNKDYYTLRSDKYIAKLSELDANFRETISTAKRKTVIFADRFPLMYFAEEYGLDYLAAYPGCTAEAEPSAATVSELIKKVNEEKIPVVFHIEMSNESIADTVCNATGAQKRIFYSCHNISAEDFSAGVSFTDLMQKNLVVLREALN